MDVALLPLPPAWQAASAALALALLATCAWRAPWRCLRDGPTVHVLSGGVVALAVLWSVRAALPHGIVIHLLGTAALSLMVGAPLGLLGGAMVAAVACGVHGTPWVAAPAEFLVGVAIPVLVTHAILRLSQRVLPPNFFVYVFVACFFGAALGSLLAGLAGAAAFAATGVVPADVMMGEYAPYLVFLAFGEGTLTGMALTLAVVYRPDWVATFDDAFYIDGR
ncbi:MAG: energy-coupling factor ABC transporter permease [Burkholderiales bacterium]